MPFTIGGDWIPSKKENKSPKKVLVRKEKKRGHVVTVISRLSLEEKELKALLKELKGLCSCGGSLKEGNIELQGDMESKVKKYLTEEKGIKL